MKQILLRVVAVAGIVGTGITAAADPPILEPTGGRSNFFGGREATLGVVVLGGDAVDGRLAWSLTAFGRTLASGAAVARHTGDRATSIDVAVAIPDAKEDAVIEAIFTAVLVDAAGTRLATHSRPVRIFPPDPFANRTRWLESLRIALVDPSGATEKVLTAAGVPVTLTDSEAAIAAVNPRLIVVGAGTSLIDRPDLPWLLARFAAQGVPVLCLSPLDGTMPLPGSGDAPGQAVVKRFVFADLSIVADLDRRLDARDWSPDGTPITRRLAVVADEESVVVRVLEPAAAANLATRSWPWLEVTYADREASPPCATFVVCGLGVVEHWDTTPAARYLFAAILERLVATPPVDRPPGHPTNHPPETTR